MYLGDDDYIPDGYLSEILSSIYKVNNLTAFIPGCKSVFPDGRVLVFRDAKYEKKIFSSSFLTTIKAIDYGHQLSGLVLKERVC